MRFSLYLNKKIFPWYGLAGLIVSLIAWYFNWTMSGFRTHIWFFPLWTGYILFIDALVYYRRRSSLINRSPGRFIVLFILSVAVWWFFELVNIRTGNWHYLGRSHFTDIEFFILSSLAFSTVMPAVFETAELIGSYRWTGRIPPGPRIPSGRAGQLTMQITGIITFILLLIWPHYFYPFVWMSVYFILDTVNFKRGRRSLLYYSNERNWQPMVVLSLGSLVCGFFWEMWNFYSYPKWVYSTPGVDQLYLFEMPLAGYLGYIPFSFELFAFYQFVAGSRSASQSGHYLHLGTLYNLK